MKTSTVIHVFVGQWRRQEQFAPDGTADDNVKYIIAVSWGLERIDVSAIAVLPKMLPFSRCT